MADHARIWLQNTADIDPGTGRLWCEDKVWPESPEEGEPTEYVRADIAADLAEALEALMRQALQSPDLRATEWGQEALELARAALRRAKGET